MLPAWQKGDLQSLGKLRGLETSDSDERLFHSGGSAREFLRSVADIRDRIDEAIASITANDCDGLLAGYGASCGTGIDTLRTCYLCNNDEDSYTRPNKWVFAVDSAYALHCLRAKAPFAVFERALLLAKSSGSTAQYGWAFEVLVHQLFCTNRAVTLHVQRDKAGEYETISMGMDKGSALSSECVGHNVNAAKEHLGSRTIDTARSSYWHPDCPSFPVLDGIACVPAERTVWYMQLTVGPDKEVDLRELAAIHDLVTTSLVRSLSSASSDISSLGAGFD